MWKSTDEKRQLRDIKKCQNGSLFCQNGTPNMTKWQDNKKKKRKIKKKTNLFVYSTRVARVRESEKLTPGRWKSPRIALLCTVLYKNRAKILVPPDTYKIPKP